MPGTACWFSFGVSNASSSHCQLHGGGEAHRRARRDTPGVLLGRQIPGGTWLYHRSRGRCPKVHRVPARRDGKNRGRVKTDTPSPQAPPFLGPFAPECQRRPLAPAAMRVITFGFANGGVADANGRYWPFAPVTPEGVVGPAAVVVGPLGSLEPALAPLDGKLRNAWSTFRQPSLVVMPFNVSETRPWVDRRRSYST
jgi:hypothetical protein